MGLGNGHNSPEENPPGHNPQISRNRTTLGQNPPCFLRLCPGSHGAQFLADRTNGGVYAT